MSTGQEVRCGHLACDGGGLAQFLPGGHTTTAKKAANLRGVTNQSHPYVTVYRRDARLERPILGGHVASAPGRGGANSIRTSLTVLIREDKHNGLA